MTTKIDDFIKRVESTAEEDLFTPRTFYHLSSTMFHEMCELLKEHEPSKSKGIDEITQQRETLTKIIAEMYEVKTSTAYGIVLMIDKVVAIAKNENTDK